MLRLIILAVTASLVLPLTAPQSRADTLSWELRNDHPYTVYVRFFSRTFDRAWPGGEDTYIFDDGRDKLVTLACEPGEQICFGGFTKSRQSIWGVGEFGDGSCESCCRTCGGSYNTTDVFN